MDRTRRERIGRILEVAGDQLPRALVGHPKAVSLLDAVRDADWWRGPERFVLPRPDALDHWEATRLGDPWAYVDLVREGAFLGLQVEGRAGLRCIERLLRPEHTARLEAFLAAAARQEEVAESAALRVRLGADGRWREAVLSGRTIQTAALGRGVLGGLLDAARAGAGASLEKGVGAIRLLRVPVDAADPVALRRESKRLVACYRPLWGIPRPRPRERKPDLDVRLAAAYRQSLRFIAGRMGPAERADLRIEVRYLQDAYREAGLQRPRLLDIVSDRLGLL